jgi:hypothetical protein
MVFFLLGLPAAIVEGGATTCPAGTTAVDTFSAEGKRWAACEDLSTPGGGLTLVPESGPAIHLPKSHEPYSPEPDENYYLGLGKQAVLGAKWDMLGDEILHGCDDERESHTPASHRTPQPLYMQPLNPSTCSPSAPQPSALSPHPSPLVVRVLLGATTRAARPPPDSASRRGVAWSVRCR